MAPITTKETEIPAQKAKNGNSEAEKLLPISERFGCEEAGRGALNGVLK